MVENIQSLHAEMKSILQKEGRTMSTGEIRSKLKYRTRKGTIPLTFQIAARANNYPDQFEVIICLREYK